MGGANSSKNDPAPGSAGLPDPLPGRPTISNESQRAAGFRRCKSEACGSPCKRTLGFMKIGWFLFVLPTALSLRHLEPPPPVPTTRSTPTEGWLPVRLNHFDASNIETFQMRYMYNDEFANSSNVVIFVGGEWAISPGWLTAGLAHELAERTSAGLFYTEHRYYGQTRPTSETAVPDLRYLTVDQALGDLAQFIQHVQSDGFEDGRYRNGSVALVGCSYAGSVASWMRRAHPHLVSVALSDSGPLRAQEDFPEYLEVITEALRSQGSEACVSSIEDAMRNVSHLLTSAAGTTRVSRLFNTCGPLQASSPLDLATFHWFGVTETFAHLVQYATPGDIAGACSRITNSSVSSDPVERLAAWITSQPSTQPCIESRYSAQVAAHTNTSYDSPQATMRLWTYQTCVEYGWYQTTSSPHQPFLATVPLEYFHQMCADFFPNFFDTVLLRSGVARTNTLFGGLTHLPDHVLSVAGGLDPWAPMAPNATHATHLAPVFVVPGVSHCRAIRPTNSSETEELENTKRRILSHMQRVMAAAPDAGGGALPTVVSQALLAVGVLCVLLY